MDFETHITPLGIYFIVLSGIWAQLWAMKN